MEDADLIRWNFMLKSSITEHAGLSTMHSNTEAVSVALHPIISLASYQGELIWG